MTTTLADFTVPTFTLYMALAVIGSAALATIGSAVPRGVALDIALGALVGGYALGRLVYAALHPGVFAAAPLRLLWDGPGGLAWQGAYAGALAGGYVAAWWHGRPGGALVRAGGVVALPLVGLAGWLGCARVGCLYGAEVETLAYYPAWLVTEGRDIYGIVAPRYDTHRFGALLAGGLLVWAGVAWWRGVAAGRAFWAMSAVWCGGMFAVGFLRADATPAAPLLRADSWLDLALLAWAALRLARSGRPAQSSHARTPAPPPAS